MAKDYTYLINANDISARTFEPKKLKLQIKHICVRYIGSFHFGYKMLKHAPL